MPAITQAEILRRTKATYLRVEEEVKRIDKTAYPFLEMIEKMAKPSSFEGGGQAYPLAKDPGIVGQTWVGDDEIEAEDPEWQLNMSHTYFNFTTAITIKHDLLTQLGYTVRPNGDGNMEDRVIDEGKSDKQRFVEYLYETVKAERVNHDKRLEQLVLGTGAANPADPVGVLGQLSFTPTTGLVGGVDRALETTVRNQFATGLTITAGGTLVTTWDDRMRSANLFSGAGGVGGMVDVFFAGSTFLSGYKAYAIANTWSVNRQTDRVKRLDLSIADKAMYFNDIPVYHLPALDALNTLYPGNDFDKVCLGLNSKTWRYKTQRGKYKLINSPQDPPKQRVTRQDIDTTAQIACVAPASNLILKIA